MFVLSRERIVKWPVDVNVPVDGGEVETHRFTAHFKLLPDSDVARLSADGNSALLKAILVGFDDVAIEGEGPAAFTPELRDRLLDSVHVWRAVLDAYLRCIAGARRKNFETPPAAGRAASPEGASGTTATASSSPT